MTRLAGMVVSMTFIVTTTMAPTLGASAAQPQGANAALRYWMAFAEMRNPPDERDVSRLLERTAAGEAPWDEARLGPILDANREALKILRRGTLLPDCDWGLEADLGPDTPIAHLARGRALARLNLLDGLRRGAHGDAVGAARTWLLGLRFSQDLGRDGTLVAAQVSRSSLSAHLTALARLVGDGKADGQLGEIADAVRRVPTYGLDWSATVRREAAGLDAWLAKLPRLSSDDALEAVASMGVAPDGLGSGNALRKTLETMRTEHASLERDVASAYGLSYAAARAPLALADARLATLSPATQQIVFRPSRPNESRALTECDRAALLSLVALRQHRLQTGGDAESLEGLDVPDDPYAGKRFTLVRTTDGLELRSEGSRAPGVPLVYRLRK